MCCLKMVVQILLNNNCMLLLHVILYFSLSHVKVQLFLKKYNIPLRIDPLLDIEYKPNKINTIQISSYIERCLSDWLRYQNHCIKFFVERKTWVKAREACQAFEGDLVTIGDANKQSFVYGNLAVGRTLWIGLRRDDKYASKLNVKLIYKRL